jgi:hypothetical protein
MPISVHAAVVNFQPPNQRLPASTHLLCCCRNAEQSVQAYTNHHNPMSVSLIQSGCNVFPAAAAAAAAATRLKVRPGMSEAELEGLLRDELVLKPGAAGTGTSCSAESCSVERPL